MNPIIILSPDAALSGGDVTAPVIDKHTRYIKNIPPKDADLAVVANAVAAKWLAEPWFTIQYKLQADFGGEVTQYDNLVKIRAAAGGGVHGLSTDLTVLDNEADDALPYVKNYVFRIFGAEHAADHYGEFGMEHRHRSYELPHDRHKRQIAIQTMINGLQNNKLDGEAYGTNWWKDLQTKYNAALAGSAGTASGISGFVGELSMLRTSIRRTLHSVLLILEGNFPDTFDTVKREWGFLKENY